MYFSFEAIPAVCKMLDLSFCVELPPPLGFGNIKSNEFICVVWLC